MDNRQIRTVDALERILGYLERHPIQPEPPLLAKMKDSLRASIGRLRELSHEQRAATIGVSGPAIREMRQHMRRRVLMPLVRVAKPLLQFAPGTANVLRVPHARATTATVAAHALDVAKALEPHSELLTSAGYPDDFIARLTAEGRRLADVTARADEARQRRSRATAAIREEIKKAMTTVTVVEGIVMARITESSRPAIEEWRITRRVYARLGRPPARGTRRAATPPPAAE